MPFREQFKNAKGQLKETTRRMFGHSSSPSPPVESSSAAQSAPSPQSTDPKLHTPTDGGRTAVRTSSSPPHFQVTAPSVPSVAKSPDGSGEIPAKSTSSLPDLLTSSNLNPAPEPRADFTKLDATTGPAPALPNKGEIGAWPRLGGFLRSLSKYSDLLGPLKPAIDSFAWCVEMYEDAASAQDDYVALRAKLEELFSDLGTHFSGNVPPSMTAGMNNICTAIESELDRISTKEERRGGRRYLEAKKDLKDVMDTYGRIHDHLERLRLNADLSMWRIVDEQAMETRLKSLTPSMSACYNSAEAAQVGRRECTPKTREQVLADLNIWRHSKRRGNMYWLNGMAGTGKTTIASSLCAMLDQSHELGASFFCTRLLPECRNTKLILPSIAYQLARFSRPFCFALAQALQEDPDLHTKALPIQLHGLIVGPLRKVADALPTDLVVVVDALDECEDIEEVALILEILAKHASELPLKVFVSSRPEPEIREKIGHTNSKLVLHDLEKSIVQEDIETYLRTELSDMSFSDSELKALVNRAGVLFIYAATAIRYIKAKKFQRERRHRLEVLLATTTSSISSNSNKEIDALYGAILTSAFGNPDLEDIDKEQMKLVLDTAICAQEPITVGDLAGLLQLEHADYVRSALEPLWSVLHVSGEESYVTTLHASFPEYMLDARRSKEHYCNSEIHHGRLTELCFERIDKNERQFNICSLESSYMLDDQVLDLEDRVKKTIPMDLAYACRYWAVHLELGGQSTKRLQLLNGFLSKRLLLWMEVLNLKKQIEVGAVLLEKAQRWCKSEGGSQEIHELVHDAWRFVTTFATDFVSRSTPHIYVSMLASWPRPGPLASHYIERSRGLTGFEGAGMERRVLALLSAFSVGSEVKSATFSPDGMRLVTGSYDKTVRVWDAQSGKLVLDPLKGHTSTVNSVAFSPDGLRIVSGSRDKTVRVWDARTGKPALNPLKGHASSVNSVVFSPDGMRIISGSNDKTVRLWDAQSGKLVLDPLEGHTDSVPSVAFSSDGIRIVSGSYDNTVRLWNAPGGKPALEPLQGHTDAVLSVAFSPDGTRIISSSRDKTVRVWDAQRGKQVLAPLEGPYSSVYSVAFSPDGMYIALGAYESTIQVWDAQSGKPVSDPLRGHANLVNSVAFSPDGMRIISGSFDKTVRIWDVQASKSVPDLLEGHHSSVYTVAFSPDGKSIVSGSYDNTLRLWNVQNGKPILEPLKGHTDTVNSVAFSPDGTRIVSGSYDNTVRVWDAESGKPVLEPFEGHSSSVFSVAFSPDGRRIISGSSDKTLRMWDAQSGKLALDPLVGHTDVVHSVAFSPDGMRIVSGSFDRTIRLWDAQSGKPVLDPLKGHTSRVCSVAFSPNSRYIASGSYDKTVRMWDAKTGESLLDPLEGYSSRVCSVAFSPNGRYIVSGSFDKTVRVWDVHSGTLVADPLKGHTGPVNSIALSPDGAHIVSGSDDSAIRMWDVSHLTDKSFPTPSSAVPHSLGQSTSVSWSLDEHGCILDGHRRMLLWIPPDLRGHLLTPTTTLLISTQGSVQLNFEQALLGESWVECYIPA